MKQKLLSIALLLASITPCVAQTEVTTYQPGITEDGITYFLPNTQIRVVVTATKTHFEPGEFCNYAERFLRLKNVTLTAYDQWQIENIKLYSFGTANKGQAYSIKMKQKTSAPLVSLSPDGRLLAINDKVTLTDDNLPTTSVTRNESKKQNAEDFKTEEILSAGSTEKMAELTANEIYDIRENRGLLTKGQADFMPKDGEQLKLMLANLDTQEEGLLQLFSGTSNKETHVLAFDITPTQDVEKQVLFNFSKYLGVVDNDDPAGTPVYFSVKDLKTLPAVNVNPNAKAKKESEDLRYIVPSRAEIKVFTDNKEFVSQSFPMAQFGRVEHLGGELFNKKNTTSVQLNPTTGGIYKIKAENPDK